MQTMTQMVATKVTVVTISVTYKGEVSSMDASP